MLIINQERNELINFSNVMNISIVDCEEEGYLISAGFIVGRDDNYRDLGYYDTKERAKEILQEIVAEYLDYVKTGGRFDYKALTNTTEHYYNLPKVYEMPKE